MFRYPRLASSQGSKIRCQKAGRVLALALEFKEDAQNCGLHRINMYRYIYIYGERDMDIGIDIDIDIDMYIY
jgi:hypothetical protein